MPYGSLHAGKVLEAQLGRRIGIGPRVGASSLSHWGRRAVHVTGASWW